MIVIRKKVLLNCLILFCVFYVSYALISSNYNSEQVGALPVDKKVIVIDARSWRRRWRSSIYKWNFRG